MGKFQWISRVLDRLDRWAMVLATLLLLATLVLMNAEVFARYLLGFSILISDEYASYFFIAATMLCMLPALRSGRFIRIEGVLRLLPRGVQAVLELVAGLCGAVVSGVLAWETWSMVQLSYELETTSIQASQTPLFIPQVILPICFWILCVGFVEYGVVSARRSLKGEWETDRFGGEDDVD